MTRLQLQWVQRKRSHLALLLSTLIILLGGGVTLLWQIQQGQSSRAVGGDIVRPPTLSAETVDKIFAEVGSPMVGTGKVVEQAARQANVDDAFALAVWWVETNDGQAGVGLNNRNPGAVQGMNGYIFYPSYAAAVTDWFTVLRSRYINRGLTSVYTICYPYVGTSSSLAWANKVVSYMQRYQGEAPPPTPTPGHAPINLQVMRPAQDPVMDRGSSAREVQRPVATTTTTAPGTTSMLPAGSALPLVIAGLMVVLALALVGWRVRRRGTTIAAVETVTEALEPAVALPPLYVNEYSPIAEPTSSLRWEQWEVSQPAQEGQSSVEPLTAASRQLFSFVAEPISCVEGVPQLSFDESVSVQKPGQPGKLRARRLVQVSSSSSSWTSRDQGQNNERSTEQLQPLYLPGLSLPGRVAEPVAMEVVHELSHQEHFLELASAGAKSASAGGLLRRYGTGLPGRERQEI